MKKLISCLLVCVLVLSLAVSVSAASDYPVDLPYESYIYDQEDKPLIVPAPYASSRVLYGPNFNGWENFKPGYDEYLSVKLADDVRIALGNGFDTKLISDLGISTVTTLKGYLDKPAAGILMDHFELDDEADLPAVITDARDAYVDGLLAQVVAFYGTDNQKTIQADLDANLAKYVEVADALNAAVSEFGSAAEYYDMNADLAIRILAENGKLPASYKTPATDDAYAAFCDAMESKAEENKLYNEDELAWAEEDPEYEPDIKPDTVQKLMAIAMPKLSGVTADMVAKANLSRNGWVAAYKEAAGNNKFVFSNYFNDLSDIVYDGEEVFLADSGNNRVVVVDKDFENVLHVIYTVDESPRVMASPTGLCVTDEYIYICDSGNGRILVYDRNTYEFAYALNKPDCAVIAETVDEDGNVLDPQSYTYKPIKVTVDIAGRVYVIAESVNYGLMELNADGTFSTFIGAPTTTPTVSQVLLRRIMPRAMRKEMLKNVPTEYNAMFLDSKGFIYCAAKTSTTNPLVKLNSQGTDVLGFTDFGDTRYITFDGTTSRTYFADLVVSEDNFLYALDSFQGKVYMYDEDGELLFAFGTNNSQRGSFYSASAIELIGTKLYVTDTVNANITEFELTDFGTLVMDTVQTHAAGRYEEASEKWQQVYRSSSNYQLAIIGLARIDIQNGDYNAAMERLKPIHEKEYYALAFEKWRDGFLKENFAWVLFGIIALALILVFVPKLVRKTKPYKKLAATDLYQKFKYGTYTMFHPFDGFWDIKREKRGNAKAATLILGIFLLFYAIRAQFSGYVITGTISKEVNPLYQCLLILLPLLFWIVSNWCFTTLMNGEGTMKDVYICTCYALKPYLWGSIPLFILTHILTAKEAMFYTVFNELIWIWVIALIFFGMMITHDYSLGWALLTGLLTIVGILIIIFIILLFVNIVQDVVVFGYNIYKELAFRSY